MRLEFDLAKLTRNYPKDQQDAEHAERVAHLRTFKAVSARWFAVKDRDYT